MERPPSSLYLAIGELMLKGIIGGLLVLWVLGFTFHIAGSLIHLLLLLAALLLANLLAASRTVV
jgi:hypothetical protein